MVTSSVYTIASVPNVIPYCASKVFSLYFAVGLSMEISDKVDVLGWEPGYVSTKMVDNMRKDCCTVCDCDEAIQSIFRDLGKDRRTFGHWKHWKTATMVKMVPLNMIGNAFAKYQEK